MLMTFENNDHNVDETLVLKRSRMVQFIYK